MAVGIRPEDMEDAALMTGAPEDRRMSVTADLVEALGSDVFVHFSVDAPPVVTDETRELAEDVGSDRAAELDTHRSHSQATVVARCGPRTAARPGAAMEVVVDTARFHFFDLGTGAAIGGTNGGTTR